VQNLVDCDPQALRESVYYGKPIIHAVIASNGRGIESFATRMVKAGGWTQEATSNKHFPEDTDHAVIASIKRG